MLNWRRYSGWRGISLKWQRSVPRSPRVKSIRLSVPNWPGHRAGQRVDVRLTAADGYQSQRSYSISSAPESPLVELTVETIPGGEVSPYLTGEVGPGDRFELRGPIGGYFVLGVARPGPLTLVAGGSGIAPLMAMLRHRAIAGHPSPATLIYSSRSYDEIIFRGELERLSSTDRSLKVIHTLTRSQPPGWTGNRRRVDAAMLEGAGIAEQVDAAIFVCGPTGFVEGASEALIGLGVAPIRIRTERFGPSGA